MGGGGGRAFVRPSRWGDLRGAGAAVTAGGGRGAGRVPGRRSVHVRAGGAGPGLGPVQASFVAAVRARRRLFLGGARQCAPGLTPLPWGRRARPLCVPELPTPPRPAAPTPGQIAGPCGSAGGGIALGGSCRLRPHLLALGRELSRGIPGEAPGRPGRAGGPTPLGVPKRLFVGSGTRADPGCQAGPGGRRCLPSRGNLRSGVSWAFSTSHTTGRVCVGFRYTQGILGGAVGILSLLHGSTYVQTVLLQALLDQGPERGS